MGLAHHSAFGAFIVRDRRSGDLLGRKKMFVAGMLSFTAMSCLCGLSTTASMLCVARLFQGVTAAFMVPQTISYIQILFAGAAERAKAVGLFGVTHEPSLAGIYYGAFKKVLLRR